MYSFVLLFLLSAGLTHHTYGNFNIAEADNSYKLVGEENLASFPHNTDGTNNSDTAPIGKHFSQVLRDTVHLHAHLPENKQRTIIFQLFTDYEQKHNTETTTCVLDATSPQFLNLICGQKSDPSFNIVAHIDRTQTQAGAVTLVKRLCSPTDDRVLLHKHQTIIQELAHNDALFNELNDHLAAIRTQESAVLSLWNEDLFYSLLKQEELLLPGVPRFNEWINNNTFLIDINSYTRVISLVSRNITLVIAATALPALGFATLYDKQYVADQLKKLIDYSDATSVRRLSVPGAILVLLNWYYNKSQLNQAPTSVFDSLANIIGGPAGSTDIVYFGDALRNIITFRKCLQTKIMHITSYIKLLKEIGALTQKNSILQEHLPLITELEQELRRLENSSNDVKRLFKLLASSTFQGKEASFFSSYGNIYVTYNLLHKLKNALVPAMVRVGELDAYVSCAQLLRETKEHKATFCLPQFIENAPKPCIQAERFWNPSINYLYAVTNNISLGGQKPPHVIVTGANAGGKSTTMKGLTINIICAQALGIAPAQSLTFTPFSSITTYLNITDDIAAGKSHFRAGAARAKDLVNRVERVKGFSLTAVDEVFNGTTFEEGQAAAYMLIEKLGSYSHNICITVTHFPEVPQLAEKTGLFTNYKVSVNYHSDGSLSRTYTLEPGVSEQKIALHILKEEGFDDTFLKKARDFLTFKKG